MRRYVYHATLLKIVDGDTLDLIVHAEHDAGFKVMLRADLELRFRLAGINTPEVHGVKHDSDEYARGMAAKQFVERWFEARAGKNIWVETHKDATGKFGRYIAEVWACEPGVTAFAKEEKSLNEALVDAGHAERVEY